jgi:multiple sugar transport system permease protein
LTVYSTQVSGSPVAFRGEPSDARGQINYGVLVAGAVIAMIPCVIIYVALQRYYVRGLVSGAVKG